MKHTINGHDFHPGTLWVTRCGRIVLVIEHDGGEDSSYPYLGYLSIVCAGALNMYWDADGKTAGTDGDYDLIRPARESEADYISFGEIDKEDV